MPIAGKICVYGGGLVLRKPIYFLSFFYHDFIFNDLFLGLLCHCNTPRCLPENSTCNTDGVCIAAVHKDVNGTLLYSYGLVDQVLI